MKKVVFRFADFEGKVILNMNNVVEISDSAEVGKMIVTTTKGLTIVKGSVDEFIKAYKEQQSSLDATTITDFFEFL